MKKNPEEIRYELVKMDRDGIEGTTILQKFFSYYFEPPEYRRIMNVLARSFFECELPSKRDFIDICARNIYEESIERDDFGTFKKLVALRENMDYIWVQDFVKSYWRKTPPKLEEHAHYENEEPITEFIGVPRNGT